MSRARTQRGGRTASRSARTSSASREQTRRPGASGPQAPPRPPADAELILRQQFTIEGRGRRQYAVPEMLIVANRQGMEYLAKVFDYLAEQARVAARVKQPLAPLVIGRSEPPVNARLSDDLAIRCVPVSDANRRPTLRQYNITLRSRQRGSLFERYRQIAEADYQKVAERIRE